MKAIISVVYHNLQGGFQHSSGVIFHGGVSRWLLEGRVPHAACAQVMPRLRLFFSATACPVASKN